MKNNNFKFETGRGFLSPYLVVYAELIDVRPLARIESEEISEQSYLSARFEHLLYILFGHNQLSIKVSFEKISQMNTNLLRSRVKSNITSKYTNLEDCIKQ